MRAFKILAALTGFAAFALAHHDRDCWTDEARCYPEKIPKHDDFFAMLGWTAPEVKKAVQAEVQAKGDSIEAADAYTE
ncbi:hypothetical protein DDE82_001874 [Stemphylium lycopersici]|nr:hypothetical protein DDE82_001874 [Stemphylium lycopersici]